MENYKQKDLVYLNFKYADKSKSKPRPAIVISNDEYNFKMKNVIIVPLTTNISNKHYFNISSKDLIKGKLTYESKIRVDKIENYEKSLIIKKRGEVNSITMERIRCHILDLIL